LNQPLKPNQWTPLVRPFAEPRTGRSVLETLLTLVPLAALWGGAAWALTHLPWAVPILDLLAAFFLVRVFILQHDAGHGSLFKQARWNDRLGFLAGVLTLTPYAHWRLTHARHHATSGNLDKRGVGDVYTMTLEEYLKAPRARRFFYRLYRHPLVMFLLGPIAIFMLGYRLPLGYGGDRPAIRRGVALTNLALLALWSAIVLFLGWKVLLLVYLPVQYLAGVIGIFLFYVQHQFEDAYWEEDPRWQYLRAAMEGSSYLKLPRFLDWLTGHIGFHHVHHLAPKIPSYRLAEAHREVAWMQVAPTVTLKDALGIAFADLHLYDQEKDRLVGFKDAARILAARKLKACPATPTPSR